MAGVYSAGDFRNGTTFEMDGGVFRVVEFQHVKPGKGSAFVNIREQKLKRKQCNIYIMMVIYIILWTIKHMTKCHYQKMI